MKRRKFHRNWKVSLFTLVCLVTFINLGLWQLDREQEKRSLMDEREMRLSQPPVSALNLATEGELMNLPVALTGYFRGDVTLLLDNVVLQGRVGFEVHQLFVDQVAGQFLVNRGFVPMGRTRQDPVKIPPVDGSGQLPASLALVGEVYQRSDADDLPDIGDLSGVLTGTPAIVQHIAVDQIASRLTEAIYPHVIRLRQDQPGALPRYWPDTVIPPEKHFGYAIQWFAMAIAVVIAWLFFSFRREEEIQ